MSGLGEHPERISAAHPYIRHLMKLLLLLLLVCQLFCSDHPAYLGMDGGVYGADLRRLGLATGSSLAVHGQTAYLIGTDSRLWSCPAEGQWLPPSGAAALGQGQKVVVEPSGTPLMLGTDGGVYRLGAGWNRVGLGEGRDLAVSENGDLYLVGSDAHLWICPVNQSQWSLYNGLATGQKVAAAAGSVYLIGSDNGVYRVGRENIERLGLASGREVSVSAAGQVAIIGMDNGVYFYAGNRWQRQGLGTARQVVWPR